MNDTVSDALAPDLSARLTAFARASKAAARAVSLYPQEHPAIGEAITRLARVAADATTAGALTIRVTPTALLVDNRAPARPDPALADLASLLHAHLVGEMTISPDVPPDSWRTWLGLIARDPDASRTAGGIAHAWTTSGSHGLVMRQLDYSQVLGDRAVGDDATWQTLIAFCLERRSTDLDEQMLEALTAIARDPERLGRFFQQIDELPDPHLDGRSRAATILRAMRGVTGRLAAHAPEGVDAALANMAAAVSNVSPDLLLEILAASRQTDSPDGRLAGDMIRRVSDPMLARFVGRNVSATRGTTTRLIEAFRALAPDPARGRAVVGLARQYLVGTPFAERQDFGQIWSQVEQLLLSYSDQAFVSEAYDRQLSAARARALDITQVPDDPPDRIARWLATVSDAALRDLDLQLLIDLTTVETDEAHDADVIAVVAAQVVSRAAEGDLMAARRLAEALTAAPRTVARTAREGHVAAALETTVCPRLPGALAAALDGAADQDAREAKALCEIIGPGLVPGLADTLASESRPRARQRLTDLLCGFGSHGRHAVDQLRRSPAAGVRRTAVHLLRTFGGSDAVVELGDLLNDPEPGVQREAVRALIRIGTDQANSLVEHTLREGADRTRVAVLEELASTRDGRAVPLLARLVDQGDGPGTRGETFLVALARLGALGGRDAVPAIAGALRSGRWWAPGRTRQVRTTAAEALAQIKDPTATSALEEAASHGSWGVRAIARRHLGGS